MLRRAFGGLAALCLVALAGSSTGCLATRGPSVPEGQLAPSFALKSHLGNEVSLDVLAARGPVVIVFYRGFW